MSGSTRRRPRRLRNRVITVDSDDSCIDLTEADEAFVDLTSSQADHGANDTSVVVIGSTSETPATEERQRSRRRRLPDPDQFEDDDDDDLIELPPAPFKVPTPKRSSRPNNAALPQSPEPIKITCPVCLDDDKMIRRERKQFASTSCGHVFCMECISDCVRAQRSCPVCRKRLYMRDVHPLHL